MNDERFVLSKGNQHQLEDGSSLVFVGGNVQAYAGGINGTKFSLEGACPNETVIKAQFVRGTNEGDFSVNGKGFLLNPGSSIEIPGGYKLTFHGNLSQDYAGGLHGVQFDLDC